MKHLNLNGKSKLMKKTIILSLTLLAVQLVSSCEKNCNCSENYDAAKTYYKGDLVKYDNICWEAEMQGRGIIPGPWMENGNDIWKECE